MNNSSRFRIVIADDHPIFRKGLRDIIETDTRFEVVYDAGDGEEALTQIRRLAPDIIILDIEMPKRDGLGVVKALHDEGATVAILILTMHQSESIFNRAMDFGVTGYLLKDSASADILNALVAVIGGKHFISPSLTEHALDRVRNDNASLQELAGLTTVEKKILEKISSSHTSSQIADELCISRRTVENHRMHISQKLGLRGSYSLLRYALENKEHILYREYG